MEKLLAEFEKQNDIYIDNVKLIEFPQKTKLTEIDDKLNEIKTQMATISNIKLDPTILSGYITKTDFDTKLKDDDQIKKINTGIENIAKNIDGLVALFKAQHTTSAFVGTPSTVLPPPAPPPPAPPPPASTT